MKHTKKLLAIAAALVMVFSLAVVLMIGTGAENATPSLTVNYANLSFGNNISVVYAVSAKNTDNVELLIWDAPQTEYAVGTQSYTVSSTGVQNINGEPHHIFFMNHLGANQMTDTLYAVAHSVVDEIDYYSPVVRYSIIEYAYDILGMDGTPSTNENLKTLVKEMLEYGAAAQVLTNYKTDSLATGDFVLVKTANGTLADGFKSTVVAEGTSVELSAPATLDGKAFHSWINADNTFVSYDRNATVNAESGTYTALYFNVKDNGFVYELNNVLSYKESEKGSMKVDGEMEDLYKTGIHLTSDFRLPVGGSTFDVYLTADAKNVYFYYYFNKQEEIFFKEEYASRHHEDCIDFCLNLEGTAALGKEFHILGGVEGAEGTAATSIYTPESAGVTDYYVKHYENSNDYSVEFAIPINKITGTDASGNKMLSFTALSTITTSWPEGQAEPNRFYTVAYKYTRDEGKATPSYVVLTSEFVRPEDSSHTVAADGNYVYEITKYLASDIAVDGLRDDAYNHGVHQSDRYNQAAGGSGYTAYFTADETHMYVLYEFTKREGIGYYDNYGSNHYKLDCADFIIDLTGAGTSINDSKYEFRILAGVEGNIDQIATDIGKAGLNQRGVDACYVKHTYNGYNVEFSIPLDKIAYLEGTTGNIADKKVSFIACSTINNSITFNDDGTFKDTSRCNPTVDNKSEAHGSSAKATPNYLIIRNSQLEYTLTETKDTVNYTDGLKDAAYDTGIHMTPMYYEGFSATNVNEKNTYDFYMTADASNVYMLFVVKDDNIIKDGASYWHNDCAEISWNTNGTINGYAGAGKNDVRFFGNTAGTNHYGTSASTCTAGGGAITLGNGGLKSYTVIHTAEGYNVEIVLERSAFANKDVFSFVAMGTFASSATSRTYVSSETGSGACTNNAAKKGLNKVTIVPAK